MSYITGPDVVKYACTCNLLKPIPYLYFCRHCSQLRCSFCVCHEVITAKFADNYMINNNIIVLGGHNFLWQML